MMTVMEATSFVDPLRERDLADLGIDAKVTVTAGPPRRLTIEIDPAHWDVLIGRSSLPRLHARPGTATVA